MRAMSRACPWWAASLAALATACDDGAPGSGDASEPDAWLAAPEIGLVQDLLEAPPGGYADTTVVALGELGAASWTLTVEGLPPGAAASFSPSALDAAHPRALLLVDLAPSTTATGATLRVQARAGDTVVEDTLSLVIAERTEPGFSVWARLPGEPGADGGVDGTVRVVSRGGFEGAVHLVPVGPAVVELAPRVVTVSPGAPATAALRVYRELEGAGIEIFGVHRRAVEHGAMASLLAQLEAEEAWPACFVGATTRRVWAPPGASTRFGGRALSRSPMGALALSLEARAPAGIEATLTPSPPDAYSVELSLDESAGAGDVLVIASAPGGVGARTSVHLVVPRASPELLAAGGALVAAPLTAPADLASVSRAEGVVIPRSEPAGTATQLVEADPDGNEVIARVAPGAGLVVTEQVMGSPRSWPPIAGAQGEPALSYDASGQLWVATRYDPGLVGVWDRSPGGLLRAHDVGLPASVIDAGPWLAAGAGPLLLAYVHEGALRVSRLVGDAWTELAAPSDVTPPDARRTSVALRQDGSGRPLLAMIDDRAGIRVVRLEGDAWTQLGELPLDDGHLALGLALALDAADRPLLAWSEAAHVAPAAGAPAGLAGSHVRLSRFEGGAWSAPIELALDPAAAPGAPVIARAATASVVAWSEPEIVVARVPD